VSFIIFMYFLACSSPTFLSPALLIHLLYLLSFTLLSFLIITFPLCSQSFTLHSKGSFVSVWCIHCSCICPCIDFRYTMTYVRWRPLVISTGTAAQWLWSRMYVSPNSIVTGKHMISQHSYHFLCFQSLPTYSYAYSFVYLIQQNACLYPFCLQTEEDPSLET
jgi:hypothetical protein